MWLGHQPVRTDIMAIILTLVRRMATMGRSISWMECLSALARGITGAIRRGSGVTGTAGRAGDMGTMAARAEFTTVATLADSHAVRCAVETPSTEVAVSMAEANSTAADIAKLRFC